MLRERLQSRSCSLHIGNRFVKGFHGSRKEKSWSSRAEWCQCKTRSVELEKKTVIHDMMRRLRTIEWFVTERVDEAESSFAKRLLLSMKVSASIWILHKMQKPLRSRSSSWFSKFAWTLHRDIVKIDIACDYKVNALLFTDLWSYDFGDNLVYCPDLSLIFQYLLHTVRLHLFPNCMYYASTIMYQWRWWSRDGTHEETSER